MEIEVKPHRPKDIISKREIDGGVYQIRIDGKLAGFIGYQDGARPMIFERRSPLELREIESAVRVALMPQRILGARVPLETPEPKRPPDTKEMFS